MENKYIGKTISDENEHLIQYQNTISNLSLKINTSLQNKSQNANDENEIESKVSSDYIFWDESSEKQIVLFNLQQNNTNEIIDLIDSIQHSNDDFSVTDEI
ncbi:Hypothetical_protein [Hexamita inflata]|uniref:Hypothetical_protein n=1 Tax=Hexamita inflata TaxID=28002 RepID=A0ABP1GDF8_9EUKA